MEILILGEVFRMEQYGSLISDYSNYSSSEGFADAAAMYVEHPEDLKQISSEVFNYINSLYQMY